MAAAGAYAFLMLEQAQDPFFAVKALTVTTVWPGATARQMQDQVAEPLEKRLQELTWYDQVETTTRPGYAYMTVTLKDSTPPSSVQEKGCKTSKKLGDEAPKLPSGVLGPFVNDEYSDVSFTPYALKAKGMPMRELARQAETTRQDLPPLFRRGEDQHPRRTSPTDPHRVSLRFINNARFIGAGVRSPPFGDTLVNFLGSIDTPAATGPRSDGPPEQRPGDRRHAHRPYGASAEAHRHRRCPPGLRGPSHLPHSTPG